MKLQRKFSEPPRLYGEMRQFWAAERYQERALPTTLKSERLVQVFKPGPRVRYNTPMPKASSLHFRRNYLLGFQGNREISGLNLTCAELNSKYHQILYPKAKG